MSEYIRIVVEKHVCSYIRFTNEKGFRKRVPCTAPARFASETGELFCGVHAKTIRRFKKIEVTEVVSVKKIRKLLSRYPRQQSPHKCDGFVGDANTKCDANAYYVLDGVDDKHYCSVHARMYARIKKTGFNRIIKEVGIKDEDKKQIVSDASTQ